MNSLEKSSYSFSVEKSHFHTCTHLWQIGQFDLIPIIKDELFVKQGIIALKAFSMKSEQFHSSSEITNTSEELQKFRIFSIFNKRGH